MTPLLKLANERYILATTPLSRWQKRGVWRAYLALLARARLGRLIVSRSDRVSFLGARLRFYTLTNFIGIVREVFVGGDYYFKARTDEPFIIDCGANIGLASLYFSHLYPKAQILALEPGNEAFERLSWNVEHNPRSFATMRLECAAAAATDGKSMFYENTKSAGGSTLNANVATSKQADSFKEVPVKTVRLSSYIDREVDLLKMDIEGGEATVLKELESSGALDRIREIVFECHYNASAKDNSVPEILALLERNGFVPVISSEKGESRFKKTPIYHFIVHAYRFVARKP